MGDCSDCDNGAICHRALAGIAAEPDTLEDFTWRVARPGAEETPEQAIDRFFLSTVEGVCERYGLKMGREIVVHLPTKQICINWPEIPADVREQLARDLEEVVGGMCE